MIALMRVSFGSFLICTVLMFWVDATFLAPHSGAQTWDQDKAADTSNSLPETIPSHHLEYLRLTSAEGCEIPSLRSSVKILGEQEFTSMRKLRDLVPIREELKESYKEAYIQSSIIRAVEFGVLMYFAAPLIGMTSGWKVGTGFAFSSGALSVVDYFIHNPSKVRAAASDVHLTEVELANIETSIREFSEAYRERYADLRSQWNKAIKESLEQSEFWRNVRTLATGGLSEVRFHSKLIGILDEEMSLAKVENAGSRELRESLLGLCASIQDSRY